MTLVIVGRVGPPGAKGDPGTCPGRMRALPNPVSLTQAIMCLIIKCIPKMLAIKMHTFT